MNLPRTRQCIAGGAVVAPQRTLYQSSWCPCPKNVSPLFHLSALKILPSCRCIVPIQLFLFRLYVFLQFACRTRFGWRVVECRRSERAGKRASDKETKVYGEWLFSRSSAIIFHVNCNPRAGAVEAEPDNDLWAGGEGRRIKNRWRYT